MRGDVALTDLLAQVGKASARRDTGDVRARERERGGGSGGERRGRG